MDINTLRGISDRRWPWSPLLASGSGPGAASASNPSMRLRTCRSRMMTSTKTARVVSMTVNDFTFTSNFWNLWIIVLTLANVLACWWLIRWTSKPRPGEANVGDVTGHKWDEDTLTEYNNPLPRWWLWLFYITLVFSAGLPGAVPGPGHLPRRTELDTAGCLCQGNAEMPTNSMDRYSQQYAATPIPDLLGDGWRCPQNRPATVR